MAITATHHFISRVGVGEVGAAQEIYCDVIGLMLASVAVWFSRRLAAHCQDPIAATNSNDLRALCVRNVPFFECTQSVDLFPT